jgi:hypothetical protein
MDLSDLLQRQAEVIGRTALAGRSSRSSEATSGAGYAAFIASISRQMAAS